VSTVRRADGRRALAVAGFAYVAAWVVGLLVAPSAPDPDAADATINAFYADHQSATLLQAALVHCFAGLALAALVVALARRVAPGRRDSTRTVFLAAGLAAAVVSLVQFGMEVALNRHVAGDGSASTTASLFHAVNIADTVKLVLLGVTVFAATRFLAGVRAVPRWLEVLGYALLPILVIGGLAFVVNSGALSAVLTASLLLLLLWVVAVTVVETRRSPPARPATA
jgi:hypothetical protein